MGLCSAIDCTCAIDSSTLTITGDGSPANPWSIDDDPSLFAFDTYDDLPDPSAFPDLSAVLVKEASELVLVRDGAYALSGTVYAQLLGTPSQTSIAGNIDVGFTLNAFTPNLPFIVSGGALVMHPYFHPAEIAIRGIGYIERSEDTFLDWVEVASASSVSGTGPFRFISDANLWMDSESSSEIVPVFGVAKPDPDELGAAPLIVTASGASFEFRARSFGGTLNDDMYIWASFTWNSFSYQGQI